MSSSTRPTPHTPAQSSQHDQARASEGTPDNLNQWGMHREQRAGIEIESQNAPPAVLAACLAQIWGDRARRPNTRRSQGPCQVLPLLKPSAGTWYWEPTSADSRSLVRRRLSATLWKLARAFKGALFRPALAKEGREPGVQRASRSWDCCSWFGKTNRERRRNLFIL